MSEAVKTNTVFVVVRETVFESWMHDASSYAMAAALIIPGWFIGSVAAQWLGVICFFIAVIGKAKSKRLTIAEARAEIDRIEAEMKK